MAGINKLLYGKKVEPETVMTAKQTMECMGVKDRHTFNQFIKEGMPYMIIGNRYYVPVNAFNKWIKEKCSINQLINTDYNNRGKINYNQYIVYKLLDKNNKVLYIGKTSRLTRRISQHIRGNSNIPEECRNQICKVEFIELNTETDMNIYEIYCISLFRPPYNKEMNSPMGDIEIKLPTTWNQFDISMIESKIPNQKKNLLLKDEPFHFNKEIFLNEELTAFIDTHINHILTKYDIDRLLEICSLDVFNIDELNDYISYNNGKVLLINDHKDIILVKMKKSRNRFGSVYVDKTLNYLVYTVLYGNNKRKKIYGKTKEELAEKVYQFQLKLINTNSFEKE